MQTDGTMSSASVFGLAWFDRVVLHCALRRRCRRILLSFASSPDVPFWNYSTMLWHLFFQIDDTKGTKGSLP